MELTPRTYRFLKLNGATFLVFFFSFSLIIFARHLLNPESDPAVAVVAALLFVAGCIVTGLHWTLLQGTKTGAIVIRERSALARR